MIKKHYQSFFGQRHNKETSGRIKLGLNAENWGAKNRYLQRRGENCNKVALLPEPNEK